MQNTQYSQWFTIDSSVLLNEGFSFMSSVLLSFMTFMNISVHLSMKTILVDLYLVQTFFGNNFNGGHPRK